MGKFTGVLLCSDYDNTIVDTAAVMRGEIEESLPGERTLKAVEYFMSEGGRFAVATGRALAAFVQQAKTIPKNAPAVLYNGAALYDFSTETYLETNYLDENAMKCAQEVLDRWSGIGAEAYNNALDIPTVQPNAITRRHQHMAHTGVEEFSQYGFFFLPLLRAFSPMCVGVLTYYFSTTAYYEKLKNQRGLFNLLVLLALPAMMAFQDRNGLHLLWSGILVLGCMEQDTWLNRLLNRRCFAGCGTLSYILYLNHALLDRFYRNILMQWMAKAGIVLGEIANGAVYLVVTTVFCLCLQWLMNRVRKTRKA